MAPRPARRHRRQSPVPRAVATPKATAGNRRLFYDQYAKLLVLSFFNPTLAGLPTFASFNALQKACLENVYR